MKNGFIFSDHWMGTQGGQKEKQYSEWNEMSLFTVKPDVVYLVS